MGKDQPHAVFFQNIKNRGNPVGLGAKLDAVALILGDLAEEFIQIQGQF